MRKAGIPGDILPWRDVLHEGPVPHGLSLDQLSRVRAKFIAEKGWTDSASVLTSFIDRDNKLKTFPEFTEVILWFEHDLYDQLQLLQLLDFFSRNKIEDVEINLICTEQYLGPLSPEALRNLLVIKQPVTDEQYALASHAWESFSSDNPRAWLRWAKADTSALPFLHGAIIRILEEYPNCLTGLSRTQYQALQAVATGIDHPWKIFDFNQRQEERIFMGDLSFWDVLRELTHNNPALLEIVQGNSQLPPIEKAHRLNLTDSGRQVLSGRQNALENIHLDRWIGGVHLNPDNLWCWNPDDQTLLDRIAD